MHYRQRGSSAVPIPPERRFPIFAGVRPFLVRSGYYAPTRPRCPGRRQRQDPGHYGRCHYRCTGGRGRSAVRDAGGSIVGDDPVSEPDTNPSDTHGLDNSSTWT